MARSFMTPAPLLSAAAATGSAYPISGGYYHWSAYGTWDTATAALEWSPDGATWIAIAGASLTANGGVVDIPLGEGHARVAVSSAGGTTSLTSSLRGIR